MIQQDQQQDILTNLEAIILHLQSPILLEPIQKPFRMHLIFLLMMVLLIETIYSCSGDSVVISSNENGILNWCINENDFQS